MDSLSISGIRLKRLLIVALVMLLSACQSAETRRAGGLIGSIARSSIGRKLPWPVCAAAQPDRSWAR